MKFSLTDTAVAELNAFPEKVRRQAYKQFGLLVHDIRHPSLHAKKFSETADLWQGRVNRAYRFFFVIIDDVYYITSITKHPK